MKHAYEKENFVKLIPELVSKSIDKDLLDLCPHTEVPETDLAVIPILRRSDGTTRLITNLEKERNHLTDSEIMNVALKNICDKNSGVLQSLNEIFGIPDAEGPKLYVVTNRENRFGAVEILNPYLQKAASDILGGDYLILPSSKHEVILAPVSDTYTPDMLSQIVQEVNASDVRPEDRLSDQVYRYDFQRKRISIAAKEKKEVQRETPKFKVHERKLR